MASPHTETGTVPSATTNKDATATLSTKPSLAADAVLKPSEPIPASATQIQGLDFDKFGDRSPSIAELLATMATMGFQASAVAEAARIINDMIDWREAVPSTDTTEPASAATPRKATIFLGYTSNLISSGLREVLRWLVQHRCVDAIVTTAGGVEEDLIKCLAPTYMGNFAADGATLREKGINRVGNLFVPNDNYCKFEDWVVPILDRLLTEQETKRRDQRLARWKKWRKQRQQQQKPSQDNRQLDSDNEYEQFERESATDEDYTAAFTWTPSTIIARLGQEINDERSVCYWAWKHDIPIFCPALTDGSLGDMLFFHSYKAAPRQLNVDICADIRRINDLAMRAAHAGIIILGGGIVKHHIANACLMRNGADKAVYINTAQEYDGSDAGARPDEAVSWGKIKAGGDTVKVYAEATLVFPLIVAATFAKVRT